MPQTQSEGNTALERLNTDRRKVELEAEIIQYFRVGCILILFTPAFSLAAIMGTLMFSQDYLLTIMLVTAWNASAVVLSTIGIALYVYGYMRRQAIVALEVFTQAEVILLLSLFLILWGVFTYLLASGLYSDMIIWSMNPDVRALTVLDYMEYWLWGLKGILWIGTGVLLMATSLMKIQSTRTHTR